MTQASSPMYSATIRANAHRPERRTTRIFQQPTHSNMEIPEAVTPPPNGQDLNLDADFATMWEQDWDAASRAISLCKLFFHFRPWKFAFPSDFISSFSLISAEIQEQGFPAKPRHTEVILSVVLTAAGVMIAALGDFSFDLVGYSMAFTSVFFQTMYLVLVEKSGAEDGLSSVEIMFYNSFF
ncbi:uncharacterized protein LOC114276887 [Camellia sinensis]|uniref:uncharacterized protein LOC114276887 n=1 Tax=Camellia sinensis TaxID=4442 RepID=UPI0010361225|nr:uncharacterized protein LOC114276887 [Camellia sinensis]